MMDTTFDNEIPNPTSLYYRGHLYLTFCFKYTIQHCRNQKWFKLISNKKQIAKFELLKMDRNVRSELPKRLFHQVTCDI